MKTAYPNPTGKVRGRWQWRFFGFALGVFLASLLTPSTGWMVRQQVLAPISHWVTPCASILGFSSDEISTPASLSLLRRGAERFPQDAAVQSAFALYAPTMGLTQPTAYSQASATNLNSEVDQDGNAIQAHPAQDSPAPSPGALLDVMRRFPNDPLPYALYLRYSMLEDVVIDRYELRYLYHTVGPDTVQQTNQRPHSAAILAEYERIGQEGERLDPDNAYFPMMLLVGHFAANRDAEALNDLDRAARKSHWNDYSAQETVGIWWLTDSTFGRQGYYSRLFANMIRANATYSRFRHAAELIQWQAILQESHGNPAAGIALRSRLMRVAVTMCLQSNNFDGILLGYSMFRQVYQHPAGMKLTRQSNETEEAFQLREQSEYIHFLQNHRSDKEAQDFQLASPLCNDRNQMAVGMFSSGDQELRNQTQAIWTYDLMLPAEILLLSLLAGATALYAYRQRFSARPMRPLPRTIRLGMAMGIVLVLTTSLLAVALMQTPNLALLASCIPLLALLALGCLCVVMRESRTLLQPALVTTASAFGLIALLFGLTRGAELYLATYLVNMNGDGANATPFGLSLNLSLGLLALPAALAYLMMVTARVRHQPLVAGSLEAFRRMALPMIGLLLLGYAGCVLSTCNMEIALISNISQSIGEETTSPQSPSLPLQSPVQAGVNEGR